MEIKIDTTLLGFLGLTLIIVSITVLLIFTGYWLGTKSTADYGWRQCYGTLTGIATDTLLPPPKKR